MPNRVLKESICTSDNLDMLTAFQETVFYRLLVNCDDYGRFDARPKILASKLFPLKEIRVNQIEDALRALTSAELVTLYEVDGKPFLQMKKWDRHQTIRNQKSKYPAPADGTQIEAIASNCKQLQATASKCSRNPIQSESNPNPNTDSAQSAPTRARGARFTPPTASEVAAYCTEKGYKLDADYFVDYYSARGWKLKTGPVSDWKACVRTWVRNDRKRQEEATAAPTRDYSDELPY